MSENKHGIEESKQVIDFIFAVLEVGKKHVADGVQASDVALIILEFFKSEEFKEKLVLALQGIQSVPVELIDIKKPEFFEIVVYVWEKVKEIIKK